MSSNLPTKDLKVADLHFDRANPRLAEYGIGPNTPEEEVLKVLWEAMDVRELVQSIAASGFFPHEALIVSIEDGKALVIEGNRRLAAVKVLLSPALAKENGWEVPAISEQAREKLKVLPGIISDRKGSWRYLGFKHVNGPAKWSSYAKAAYIADVHRLYKVSLADIASQIGDRHNTVQRLYRGLMVLEQAEREKVIFDIIGEQPPWLEIKAKYRTHRLLVECKNTDEPTDADFSKLNRDMQALDVDVAFMAYRGTRREPRGKVLDHQRSAFINSKKERIIVTLSEVFLIQCLEKKTNEKSRQNLNALWRDHVQRWLPT
jgi:hypothetical protein